jgi:hypothetical protein
MTLCVAKSLFLLPTLSSLLPVRSGCKKLLRLIKLLLLNALSPAEDSLPVRSGLLGEFIA